MSESLASISLDAACKEAGQEAALKKPSRTRQKHAEHRYREAGSIVNDILPGKFIRIANEQLGE